MVHNGLGKFRFVVYAKGVTTDNTGFKLAKFVANKIKNVDDVAKIVITKNQRVIYNS